MNVLDLLRKYCEPRKAANTHGGEYHSPCPGCGGEDRFHVWPEENEAQGSYWCRQCGKGGDAIQFLRDFEGMSFKAACEYLGQTPKEREPYETPRNKQRPEERPWEPDLPEAPPPELWREKAGKLVQWAYQNIMRDAEQLAWLAERGIDEYGIKFSCLGWNPADIFRPRESWGLPTELKEDDRKKRLWIPRGLVIPLKGEGEIWRVRIRRPEGDPRYYVLPGSSSHCMVKVPKHRAFIIVESELDAVLLDREVSDLAGIVALGNSSRKPDADTCFYLKNAAVILIALDYDDAGAKAVRWWQEQFPQAKRWPVPEGKDPGEAYQAGIDLREWVKAGLPPAWFI